MRLKILKERRKEKKRELIKKLTECLREDHACYVLLMCKTPSNKGEMQVQMVYEGDEDLASYLIDNAQAVFEEKMRVSQDL